MTILLREADIGGQAGETLCPRNAPRPGSRWCSGLRAVDDESCDNGDQRVPDGARWERNATQRKQRVYRDLRPRRRACPGSRPASVWLGRRWAAVLVLLWMTSPLLAQDGLESEVSVARVSLERILSVEDGVGGAEKGLGISLDLDHYYRPSFGLRASLGYFQLDADPVRIMGEVVPESFDRDVFYLRMAPLVRLRKSRFAAYAGVGAGIYLSDFVTVISVGSGVRRLRTEVEGGSFSFGVHLEGGVDFDIGDRLLLGTSIVLGEILYQGENLTTVATRVSLGWFVR